MRETALRHAGDAPPWRPKLLLAGAWEGTLAVLARHLAQQDVWEISGAATLTEAEARLPEIAPDVLVAVWTEEADVMERAATLRRQVPGSRLLVIIVGCPPRHGSASPTQPARGVLCLPRPLKWRTLLLCLDEHWRTLQRKAS